MSNPSTPKYMTARKFAEYTGLSYHIVLELIKAEKLRGFRRGNKTFYILVESYHDIATSSFDSFGESTLEEREETAEYFKTHKEVNKNGMA